MKYNILINQLWWSQGDFKSLDIIDLAIFDAIKSFMASNKAETITINNQVFYWVSPQFLINELPVLGINTTRGINKRINNLIEVGLLERCPDNQSVKKTYFRAGVEYEKYESFNRNENSALGTVVPTLTWNGCSNNNNTNIYHNTNIKEKDTKEKKLKMKYADFVSMTEDEYGKLVSQYGETATKECINILNNYKGSKGKTYKSDYLAILSWVVDRYNENVSKQRYQPTPQPKPKKKIWEEFGVTEDYYRNVIMKENQEQ